MLPGTSLPLVVEPQPPGAGQKVSCNRRSIKLIVVTGCLYLFSLAARAHQPAPLNGVRIVIAAAPSEMECAELHVQAP
jgi:hypothetical protein